MVVETQEATDDVSVRLREQLLETAAQLEQARTRHRCVVISDYVTVLERQSRCRSVFRLDVTELKNRVELLSNRPPATTDDAAANAEQEAGDSDVSKAAVTSLNASDAQYVERELLLLQETIMTLKV